MITFYQQNITGKHLKGVTSYHTKKSIAQIFADKFSLIRAMNLILRLSYVIYNWPNIGIDRIGTHVLENFFGNIRYAYENYDSWENILSAVSNGQIRNSIFQKYGINVQIKNRINVGGIHFYDADDEELPSFDCAFTSYTCHKVLCKLTNDFTFDPTDNLELLKVQYQNIKNDFLNMISEKKEKKEHS